MLLYKSHYIITNYLETKYSLHIQWTEPADLLDEVGYYSEVVKFFERRIKRPGRLILWDMRVIDKRINQKFIKWLEEHIIPVLLSIKAQKLAYVLTGDIAQSIEQGQRSFGNKSVEVKVFSSQQEAMKWLTQGIEPVIRGPEQHHHH